MPFISIEGGEGSGKSTQIKLLADALTKANIPHLITREPGGEPGAERIRELLVSGDKNAWDATAETLLFYAARVQHMARKIQPALDRSELVVCDRFTDSTLVYQGVGKGLSAEFIRSLHHLTLGNTNPTLTIILDIDPHTGLSRAASRKGTETRFEGMALEFHEAVRAGFLAIARNEPQRCCVIDATQPTDIVHFLIRSAILSRLGIAL